MKNIDMKQLATYARLALDKLRRYSTFIFIITILLIYAFLIVRINILTQAEPDDSTITEQSNTVKRLKIDQNSIDKIEELEDQSIEVKSLFKDARDNPFKE